MTPMAIPAVGGMAVEVVTLFVVPVLFSLVEELRLRWRAWRGVGG
jgi:Cu(I)/Ag(I) efflux system membrane protein CusA/SilA